MRLLVVDTGLGNLRSVEKALVTAAQRADVPDFELERSADPDRLRSADKLVVPGQGAFRDCMIALGSGLGAALLERIAAGTPYLGICLGLQILFDASAEADGVAGLGHFGGRVERLTPDGVKIPHMGHNQLEPVGAGHPLLDAAGGRGAWVYYVHSYHAVPRDPALILATSDHGPHRITAAVGRDNVFAVQFHPEKSQDAGLALLAAFVAG